MSDPLADRPRVCVVGAGAVGGFFGAQMAAGHARVSTLARGATLQALRARGWGFERDGVRRFAPVQAVDDAHELGPQDVVVLSVKAPVLPQVAAQVTPLLGPGTLLIAALNGVPWWFQAAVPALASQAHLASVDPGGTLARAFPQAAVLGAVVYPACSRPEPGVSRHDAGTRLVFGEPQGHASARLASWVALLRRAGLDAEAAADIRTEVWRKLMGNAAFNPVSLLVGATTDRLIDAPNTHALFVELMHETLAVGRAIGLRLDVDVPARIAQSRRLGAVKTSMLQDAETGRPVELQSVLGAVVELADRFSVKVPAARTVWALAQQRATVLGLM